MAGHPRRLSLETNSLPKRNFSSKINNLPLGGHLKITMPGFGKSSPPHPQAGYGTSSWSPERTHPSLGPQCQGRNPGLHGAKVVVVCDHRLEAHGATVHHLHRGGVRVGAWGAGRAAAPPCSPPHPAAHPAYPNNLLTALPCCLPRLTPLGTLRVRTAGAVGNKAPALRMVLWNLSRADADRRPRESDPKKKRDRTLPVPEKQTRRSSPFRSYLVFSICS